MKLILAAIAISLVAGGALAGSMNKGATIAAASAAGKCGWQTGPHSSSYWSGRACLNP